MTIAIWLVVFALGFATSAIRDGVDVAIQDALLLWQLGTALYVLGLLIGYGCRKGWNMARPGKGEVE